MMVVDLDTDERLFLKEAADFEQTFPMLIAFVHEQHPELSLPAKFEKAQSLVERLCAAGLMHAILVKYVERKSGFFEVADSQVVPFDLVKAIWSNPYLWGRHSEQTGGAFVGVAHDARSCLALEPTKSGNELLANL